MTIEHIEDHVAQAAASMISQYHDKPRMNAVLKAYVAGAQDAEDMLWDVMLSHLLDSATGDRLETVGKLVGQARKGSNDDQYRLYIEARIRVNRSNGKPQDIVALMQLLLADYEHEYRPMFPASVMIEARGLDLVTRDPEVLAELFCSAVAGGVACEFRWSEQGAEDTSFTFSATGAVVQDEDLGFSGLLDTNSGGGFTSVITG